MINGCLMVVLISILGTTLSGASVIDLCRFSSEHNEVMDELCGAQMDVDAVQNRLERLAEKIVPELGAEIQKRKNEFVRFGRSDLGETSADEAHDMGKRKNEFVRFGKRKNEFVRFGKRKNEFVRFGKKSDDTEGIEKRKNEFVRFG